MELNFKIYFIFQPWLALTSYSSPEVELGSIEIKIRPFNSNPCFWSALPKSNSTSEYNYTKFHFNENICPSITGGE